MGGLFGGGEPQVQYVQQPVQQPEQAAKKGATDLEKMRNKKSLQDSYGKAMSGTLDNFNRLGFQEDTTLANGSLLSLGGKLG